MMRRVIGIMLCVIITMMVTPAYTQTVMLDDTGSMDKPKLIRDSLVDAVTNTTPFVESFGLVMFSERPLSAQVVPVGVTTTAEGRSILKHVNAKRAGEVRQALRVQLEQLLAADKPSVASTTKVGATMRRADMEAKPTLVVTDGNDETNKPPSKVGEGDGVFVVLCADKRDDTTQELELFETRKAQILKMLPNATVYACQLRQAVEAWAKATGNVNIRKVSQRME